MRLYLQIAEFGVYEDNLRLFQQGKGEAEMPPGFQGTHDAAVFDQQTRVTRPYKVHTKPGPAFWSHGLNQGRSVVHGRELREGRFYFQGNKLLGTSDRAVCRFRNLYSILLDTPRF